MTFTLTSDAPGLAPRTYSQLSDAGDEVALSRFLFLLLSLSHLLFVLFNRSVCALPLVFPERALYSENPNVFSALHWVNSAEFRS